ncbi:DUF3268 family zinc-finger domain-containing protein [Chitinophaga pinensis]|uniref:Uncharacterized protein n=1 Tax=Chitinophaga pinensis (strain ATCC 43595 / DSM 2588 / LMG 13176 / NBRC 15968 / NCIMB 11800 / UQM 2034) TaxID=485918 RepID=A0A979G5P9_CHIPD|nr:DUF3268 family zinc-finger domain-containing protein [Chitinophaga pinensis]ACU61319.1 conserved hypothetical protein [Chitinophaga pinensis DSM 2588]
MKRVSDPVLSGQKCPYCGRKTVYVDSAEIYALSYGMIYLCRPCNAYCGVHKGTDIALGRVANATLRNLKKEAHSHFDQLWKQKGMTRKNAYKWLSSSMDIPKDLTHIGMFDEEQCRKVINLCKTKVL